MCVGFDGSPFLILESIKHLTTAVVFWEFFQVAENCHGDFTQVAQMPKKENTWFLRCTLVKLFTLPEINIFANLKMDGWKTIVFCSFWVQVITF